MATVRISERASQVLDLLRAERSGPLSFTIDGGCCEGAAPHLFEHAVITSAAEKAGEAGGVPVYLQPALVESMRDADLLIDVVEDALSDAMSIETGLGLRFVLR